MEDEIAKLCESRLLPKLPFLLEERDESSLEAFFREPIFEDKVSGKQLQLDISLAKNNEILEKLVNKLKDDADLEWWRKLTPNSRANIIIFLSENYDESQLWSNSELSSLVTNVCNQLSGKLCDNESNTTVCSEEKALSLWFRQNHDHCLTPKDTDFRKILQVIRVKYTKADWKYYPASVHGFGWILNQVTVRVLIFHSSFFTANLKEESYNFILYFRNPS